jgi:hypothetical protein
MDAREKKAEAGHMPVENAKTDATDVGGYSPPFIRHQIRTHDYYIGRMFPALKPLPARSRSASLRRLRSFASAAAGTRRKESKGDRV